MNLPRIKRGRIGYSCAGMGFLGFGRTPRDAYICWLEVASFRHSQQKGPGVKPKFDLDAFERVFVAAFWGGWLA